MTIPVQGGEPPPELYCAYCGAPLTGRREHRRDDEGHLFCNEAHRSQYAAQKEEVSPATSA